MLLVSRFANSKKSRATPMRLQVVDVSCANRLSARRPALTKGAASIGRRSSAPKQGNILSGGSSIPQTRTPTRAGQTCEEEKFSRPVMTAPSTTGLRHSSLHPWRRGYNFGFLVPPSLLPWRRQLKRRTVPLWVSQSFIPVSIHGDAFHFWILRCKVHSHCTPLFRLLKTDCRLRSYLPR